jgi:DNA modification methylase
VDVNRIITGECRTVMRELIADGVKAQCVVTSPPYWGLRAYGTHPVLWADGWSGELGLEPNPRMYVEHMMEVFRLVRDVMADDGILFLNIGDTYITRPCGDIGQSGLNGGTRSHSALREASKRLTRMRSTGLKLKDMALVPERLAIALQDDGWWVRRRIIWHKTNCSPESVKDRFTVSHELIWMLAKSERYFFNRGAIQEPASPNTHARMKRAHGGYAPPGQDKHSGILAPRANANKVGLGQKAVERQRWPSGWARGAGSHREKVGRYPQPKANESFLKAISGAVVKTRNMRDVWSIPTEPYKGKHYATFPRALARRCILAGSRPGDLVFDPFIGSGTTAEECVRLSRLYVGIDLDGRNEELQARRLSNVQKELVEA